MKTYNNFFGEYGGRYVAEVLRPPLEELEEAFLKATEDPVFLAELEELAVTYTGRPTPLLHAKNSSRKIGGGQIFIKLEGLASTGLHGLQCGWQSASLAWQFMNSGITCEFILPGTAGRIILRLTLKTQSCHKTAGCRPSDG